MSTEAGLSKVFELRGLCMSEQPALVQEVAQRLREDISNKQTAWFPRLPGLHHRSVALEHHSVMIARVV